jgi:hypothetical protein
MLLDRSQPALASQASSRQGDLPAVRPWSEAASGVPGCATGGHCVLPAGEVWKLDVSAHVETLTIKGTLTWDTTKKDLELRAGYVFVDDGGHLEVGTTKNPMELNATIYITKTNHSTPMHGTRFLGGHGSAKVDIHGRKLDKTWTVLSHTAYSGETKLHLKDDPVALGWRPGDRIGLATTQRAFGGPGESTVHRIYRVESHSLTLMEPLQKEYWGGHREVHGRSFEMAAEVVNLERSILITGDHEDIEETGEGLHTMITGTGYMDMRYARVEHCGQRPLMGRYCLHFHLMRICPKCVFEGNAVVNGQQVGITVHGTHQARIHRNVLWDAKAVGLYTEDGNEMNNTFSENAVICSYWEKCSVQWVGGAKSQSAGAFWLGMTNNLIGNHIVGYENGFWTPGIFQGNGKGQALLRACPAHTPFGEIRSNVMHDNARFGLYLDSQFPRKLKRDEDGFLTDPSSCDTFTADGKDNGFVNEVHDHFDWHNTFVGFYALGDVQLINYTGVNNGHAMYWKASKNFADGRLWHVVGSTFVQEDHDYGVLQFLGPSGPFTFGMKDTTFLGTTRGGSGALQAGQHCGYGGAGSPCNVQYLLENVDFSGLSQGSIRIQHGVPSQASDEAFVLPVFLSKDNSLNGHRSIVSKHLNGFSSGCVPLGSEWGGGFGCDFAVRRLNVWGPSLGELRLSGPGFLVQPNWVAPTEARNSGRMHYVSMHGGYGALAIVGSEYTLNATEHHDAVVEFSDNVLEQYMGTPESITLRMGSTTCFLHASDSRPFLTPMGHAFRHGWPFTPMSGYHTLITGGALQCAGPEHVVTCAPFSQWPDVDNEVTCGGCRALVKAAPYGGRCDAYCQSFGHVCVAAAEDADDTCKVKHSATCDAPIEGTSDILCTCALENEGDQHDEDEVGSGHSRTDLLPTCSELPDVKETCSADGCKVLADHMLKRSCHDYCESSGLMCVGAWEEEANDCVVKENLTCSDERSDTSDLICECQQLVKPSEPEDAGGSARSTGIPTWVRHPGTSCSNGHGAEAVEGSNPIPETRSLNACQVECEADDTCDGIQVPSNPSEEVCWLFKHVQVSECESELSTDLWKLSFLSPTTATTTTTIIVPNDGSNMTTNRYERVGDGVVGAWGGWCTCPDGQRYKVGDNLDHCGSLACVGGELAQCEKEDDSAREGMRVVCAVPKTGGAAPAAPLATVRLSLATVELVDGYHVTVLQAEGARQELTPGGQATAERRTLYFYEPDGNEVGQATYHGASWPLVSIPEGAFVDIAIGALVRVSENQNGVLLINDRPAYQYVGDENVSAATGNDVSNAWSWFAVESSHTTTTTTTATAITTTTLPAPALSWTHYRGVHCREGHGAEDIAGKSPFLHSLTLDECKVECELDAACEGIVMFAGQFPGTCWLHKMSLASCTAFVDYDVWVRDDRITTKFLPGSFTSNNVYEKVDSGVGAWGGLCTCPDGNSYSVGDNHDACGSLACIGGISSECVKVADPIRDGRKVTCAPASNKTLAATTATTTTTAPTEAPHSNTYEKVANVGAWGGLCICPDGQSYNVGDNNDSCESLACIGGTAGECMQQVDNARNGMQVTCAGPDTTSTQPDQPSAPTENVYEWVDNVGAWGGVCTCPDGQTYQVGDNNDSCGSLACVGGTPGQCNKEAVADRQGMKVVCA